MDFIVFAIANVIHEVLSKYHLHQQLAEKKKKSPRPYFEPFAHEEGLSLAIADLSESPVI